MKIKNKIGALSNMLLDSCLNEKNHKSITATRLRRITLTIMCADKSKNKEL